ncbi:diadenosine tetraphosphate (Ap4A) HIT family hydrolase [Tamilnaduibacter salinus]|uniref:Diadenosine tetraphosphate (Ap4A) HIT family hydrolase n=1 Tax=Tamilnaduibacter salinus TaxID=1484056 RepID=A0A2U1CXB4_9GAMM|nr:HIT family protein [Tamilnaduibacter salinus]PVY76855.1 diadenosine tetraphosphate (Ap4A) HIT family hydrolase [Tamilnaduibacter salinus]
MSRILCPFCSHPEELQTGVVLQNDYAHARLDAYPVSDGHLLIVPKRHAADWFDLTTEEQQAIMDLVEQGKQWLDAHYQPDGYNIGMNCGEAAGQTVRHMHCHLIPRHSGDVADPRGGVRWVMPDKADYWSER